MTPTNCVLPSVALAGLIYTAIPAYLPASVTTPIKTHATAELTSDTTSQWIQESLTAQLHSLFDLRENWDGYGAKPLHDDTRRNAELALAVLKYATLQPDIIPNPNGTVSFEWETEKGEAYLEVGRSRFVALVRPNGSGDISMSGVVRDGFTTAIGNLAHIVEAALLPSVSHTLTIRTFAAEHVRAAA